MTREVEDRILKDVDGNISDHLHNHIHLTNCIHLKNHIHKNSPTLGDRELMRDLVFLQRSRSLRDPSATPLSLQSPSVVDLLLKRGTTQDRQLKTPSKNLTCESYDAVSYSNHGNGREVYLEKNHEEAGNSISRRSSLNRGRRRRFRGARTSRSSTVTRDIEARKEMSVASNSFEESGASQNINGVHRNGCGIPLNWSTIHHRGKSFLDVAGRSLSCGLSESRLKKGGYTSRGMDIHNMPLMSSSSSRSDASNYLEDLGIYASNLLNQETDSDLASEGRSNEQHRFRKHNEKRHQTLTQKYKPTTFKDLVGQSLVVQSLSNAIAKRKVGLLYLFYGPHGTGKTSCARIFSRALNCSSLEHPKPCGYCKPCIEQSTGKSVNVKEIGPLSSNTDLETVIGVVGNANSSQLQSRYRVFIFDECDSVSSDWWSAILKVIDRAPRRVVFILVCSSLEALPHVIISRCQKFFFPKIKDADVIYTLQWIATKEGLEIDKDAAKLIASRSDGSLRDAEMTLEQLSLLGEKISIGLVQEMVGLISDEKLVDLLDLALSADTVNTVKNLRDIMESGVEPLALMSQLATVITDILAGIYDFTRERPRRKFFQQLQLSKGDTEKLRQALRTFSEAEKQIRVSNERITWLTAALLQLAPSQATSFNHSPLILNGGASLIDGPRKSNCEISTSEETGFFKVRDVSHDKLEAIWLDVLEKIKVNSVREFMYQEGKLIGVNYGAAPTVQLFFNSQLTKSKAENLRLHMIQAFESVLRCPVTIEFRCESRKGNGRRPILLPAAQIPSHLNLNPTTNTNRWKATTIHENRDVSPSDVNGREIVEVDDKVDSVGRIENAGVSLALVKSKVSLAHVIQHAEGCSQHSGWLKNRAVSIAEKLELENLRLEPSSRRSLCWNVPTVNRRKLSRLRIRTRKPRTLLKFVSCGRCMGRSPRKG